MLLPFELLFFLTTSTLPVIFPATVSDEPCPKHFIASNGTSALNEQDFTNDPCHINRKKENDRKLNEM